MPTFKNISCNADGNLDRILISPGPTQSSSPSCLMEAGIEPDPSSGNPVPYIRPVRSSQSQAKYTTEDHGPLGPPPYEKMDEPLLRGRAEKRY